MKICKECRSEEAAPARSRCWGCYYKHRKSPKPIGAKPTNQKVLFLDIETKPMVCYTWGLFDVHIGVEQIIDPGGLLCFAASWWGDVEDNSVMFFDGRQDHYQMVKAAWTLLDQCDILVTYYGTAFDTKHLNREFLENGFPPPSPFKQVDLKKVASKNFKFPSNKLQYVSTVLGQRGKEQHEGFPLWKKCIDGDQGAWERMEAYNRQDVVLLEDVFEIMLPWIDLPSRWLYDGEAGCPKCGSDSLESAGFFYTKVSKFKQVKCTNCGSHFREGRRVEGVDLQTSVLN